MRVLDFNKAVMSSIHIANDTSDTLERMQLNMIIGMALEYTRNCKATGYLYEAFETNIYEFKGRGCKWQ